MRLVFLIALFSVSMTLADALTDNSSSYAQQTALDLFSEDGDVKSAIEETSKKLSAYPSHKDQKVVEITGDPQLQLIGKSCGTPGCYYTFLVTQLLEQKTPTNSQVAHVTAKVFFLDSRPARRPKVEVIPIELTQPKIK